MAKNLLVNKFIELAITRRKILFNIVIQEPTKTMISRENGSLILLKIITLEAEGASIQMWKGSRILEFYI